MKIAKTSERLIEKMQLWDKKHGGYINFKLWPKQVELLKLIQTGAWVILLKKRQVGGSQLVGADSLANMMGIPKWICLVLSKSGGDAEEFLNRVKECYHSLPKEVQDAIPIKRETMETLELANGSRIVSLPSNRGAGMTADRVVIDEGAFITKSESGIDLATVLKRVQPTIEKANGQLIIISTANGFGLFRDMYYKAKSLVGKFKNFFFSCFDDPTFDEADRQEVIEQFGEDHANQEYPRNDDEAFLSSGRPRFNVAIVNKYESLGLLIKTVFRGILEGDGRIIPKEHNSNFKLFKTRDKFAHYIVVADVSEGLGGEHDPCIAKVFNRETMEQVCEYCDNTIGPDDFADILVYLGRYFNNSILIVEKNKDGNTTLSKILQLEYPEELIFAGDYSTKEKADDDFRAGLAKFGWRTTSTTRPMIINCLSKVIQEGFGSFNAEDISEMRSFTINKGKAQAEQGMHDDRIITLGIAYYLMTNDTFNEYYEIKPQGYYEKCSTCWNYESDNTCSQTKRKCDTDDWCSLYDDAGVVMMREHTIEV